MSTNSQFQKELTELINRHSMEEGSHTPDYILATYLWTCLQAFNRAMQDRTGWYGIKEVEALKAKEEADGRLN